MPLTAALDPREYDDEDVLALLTRRAEAIADDLRRRAAALDREGAPPHAEIDALRKAGLLTALHPAAIGGGGLSWKQALRLVRTVSRGETGVGQLLGYHYVNAISPYWAAPAEQAAALGVETVRLGLYWGAVVNPRDPGLTLTRTAHGYRLNGHKSFSTAAHVTQRAHVNAAFEGKVANLVISTDRPGYIANDDWDNIGVRLSDSGSVEFRDFPVEDGDFVGPPVAPDATPHPLATFNTPFIQLVFVNFYLGTAEGALQEALDYVRTTTRPWVTSGVERAADDPYILERVGTFGARLKATAALADRSAQVVQEALAKGREVTAEERGAAAIEAYAAKLLATETALEVTGGVFELMGARATARAYGFDRYWRNVRTHTLHDPAAYKAREVGDFLLNFRLPEVSLYS